MLTLGSWSTSASLPHQGANLFRPPPSRLSRIQVSDTVFSRWAALFFPAMVEAEAAHDALGPAAAGAPPGDQQQQDDGEGDDEDEDEAEGASPQLAQRDPAAKALAAAGAAVGQGAAGGGGAAAGDGGTGTAGPYFHYVLRLMCSAFMSWRQLAAAHEDVSRGGRGHCTCARRGGELHILRSILNRLSYIWTLRANV